MNELIRRDSSLKTTKKILVKDEYARRILGIPEWCRGKVCLLCPVNRNLRLSDKDDPFLI